MSDAPRFLEFFAGAGLVRQALEPQWRCVWANDISPKKAAVYRENFGTGELHVGDLTDVPSAALPHAELAWASFPCQDLSLAGWRRGMNGSRSGAFWAFWNLMRELQDAGHLPRVLVLENVTGLLQGEDFAGLCEALAALDLQYGALTIDARHFVPQSRPRVFFVATVAPITRLTGSAAAQPWASPALERAVAALPTPLSRRWAWWQLPVPVAPVPVVVDLIQTSTAEWFDDVQVEHLLAMMDEPHRKRIAEASAAGEPRVGFLYRRVRQGRQRAEVRFDGLAGCLRTPAGGSSRQTVVLVEGDRVRMRLLTAREAARLMGAPDSFRLPDNYNDAYRAMGDGVCVPAVAWLANRLLKPLVDSATETAASSVVVPLLERTQQRADRWFRDRP